MGWLLVLFVVVAVVVVVVLLGLASSMACVGQSSGEPSNQKGKAGRLRLGTWLWTCVCLYVGRDDCGFHLPFIFTRFIQMTGEGAALDRTE